MRFGDSRANSTRGVGGLQEVRTAYRSVSLRTRWPPALPGCGVGMAERGYAGLRKMRLLLVVLLAPASQGAPGVCVEDVPDGLPMTCTAMDAATPALSCSTLYRMGYQCCPQCGPCTVRAAIQHGSRCSSGSSGAPFSSIAHLGLLLGAIFACLFTIVRPLYMRTANTANTGSGFDCCFSFIIIYLIIAVIAVILVYLLATFVIAGAAGVVFGSASSVWLAAAASLILLPCCCRCYLMIRYWCHDQQEQERRKHAPAERARAMLLKRGPAKLEKVTGWQPGQWQQFYFALRPHSGTTAAALLWWKDAAAFGEGSEHGGDPNNGKELGQFSLRGATLTCPPPSKSREPGTLFRKQVKRLELRRRDSLIYAEYEHELVLIFRVGKEDAAAAEWEAALRRALAPSAQQGASSARPTSTPPPRIPVVTGTPVEPPQIEEMSREKPAAAGKQKKALELV